MNELDNDTGANRQGYRLGSIVSAIVVCLLSGAMMRVGFGLCCPAIAEDRSVLGGLCHIAIWLVSIGLGIWQFRMCRRK